MTDPIDLFTVSIIHENKRIARFEELLQEAKDKRDKYVTQLNEWARRKSGAEIECVLCTDYNITFFDIMKKFCSDMIKVSGNICQKHRPTFETLRKEWLNL